MLRVSYAQTRIVGAVVLLLSVMSVSVLLAAEDRSYVSGNTFLQIDGAKAGFLKSVEGGGISAEVISEPAGPNYFIKKHIGQPKYENLSLQVGFSMSPSVYEWISTAWKMQATRKNCQLTALDFQLQPKSARQFTEMLIAETSIPACDGSSSEPAYITMVLTSEMIQDVQVTGSKEVFDKTPTKVWLPSSFKLQIDGLDCTKVNKIDSFTVKQGVVTDDIGDARDYAKEPGKLEFPNLRITLAETTAQSWKTWFDNFVVVGNNDETQEKSGTLTFLSPNLKDTLAQIKFHNLGICKYEKAKLEASTDAIQRVVVELYCEKMEFVTNSVAIGSSDTSSTQRTEGEAVTPPSGLRKTIDEQANITRSLRTNKLLDASLTGIRKFGTSPAIDFAMKGLEYTITRQHISDNAYIPDAKNKLMLIRYTMHNPMSEKINVDRATLQFVITDSAGVNHESNNIGIGANNVWIGGSILPDQTMECRALVMLPGNVDADALMVTYSRDESMQRYNVAGQVSLVESYARDESVGAAASYTALAEVPAKIGDVYPLLEYDFRLDSLEYGERPKYNSEPAENTKCLLATFTVRNPSTDEKHFDSGTFKSVLIMSDGSSMHWRGYPLSDQRDAGVTGGLTPGQEMKMRVFFDVPASGNVKAASFRFAQGDSRVYRYDLERRVVASL